MTPYDAVRFAPPAPVAHVTLRNPSSGELLSDVPMLLDTGADATLLPSAYVGRLGMVASQSEQYELRGFDGNITVADSVDLHLLWLDCTFRGRFLLTAEPYGILGRNVLNCLSLVFDGPQLAWRANSK